MATDIRHNSSKRSKSSRRRNSRRRRSLQKPNGTISRRVRQVGGDRFAIVCVDPAKHRSEWMMADYFGKLLVPPRTVEHHPAHFELAVQMIRQARQEHRIEDMIVTVERTGNYHVAPQRAAKGGVGQGGGED